MSTKFQKPEAPKPLPGVEIGDELYFQHKGAPKSGKCVAHGQHGVTLHCEGAHHKVYWRDILGHKARVSQNHKIVEHGEGGAILESVETGKRMYVAGELPLEDEMNKSILFFKAIANRPGLALKDEVDKSGHSIKRWERINQEQKKPDPAKGGDNVVPLKPGQRVAFKAGEHEGAGEVVASGKDGAQVKDAAGRVHNIHHHELTTGVHPDQAPADAGGGFKLPELFTAEEVKALPKDAVQPVKDKAAVFKLAEEALPQFKAWLVDVSNDLGVKLQSKAPEDTDMSQPGGMLFIAPIKSDKRATEKVEKDYGGHWEKLVDAVRASIAVDTMEELKGVLDHLKQKGLKLARAPKDRFNKPLPSGYRDLMMNITLENGMVAELQLHVKEMIQAKEAAHHDYEVQSAIERNNIGKAKHEWAPEDQEKWQQAFDAQEKIYGAAWSVIEDGQKAGENADSDSAPADKETLSKSLQRNKMVMLWTRKG